MIRIQLSDFQDSVVCQSSFFTSRKSFSQISHCFTGGKVYGIVSDFGCGSWGLVTCLGGRCECPDGEVFLDGERIECSELTKYSCFVSESLYDGVNSTQDYMTPRRCIERALSISGLLYSVGEIKEMFALSGDGIDSPVDIGRFNRDLRYVSGEIWRISVAVGFAMGKEVFCFPWLNEREVARVQEPYVKTLREKGKIVLIPSGHRRQLKKVCDEVITV